jgi:hypothetical protein
MCGSRYGVRGLLYALCAMPANLSPEYKNAEQAFRAAREPRERLDCLKEMLRTIPKHKGTERIQADIKSRIKQFSDDLFTLCGQSLETLQIARLRTVAAG